MLDLKIFVEDILRGAVRWLRDIEGDAEKAARLGDLVQYRSEGFGRHMQGVPTIA
jgi:hypothetical protein